MHPYFRDIKRDKGSPKTENERQERWVGNKNNEA